MPISLLVLGAGWTSSFLLPLLEDSKITHAATSRNGRDNTIPFIFDPDSQDLEPYKVLPPAETILISFPLEGHGQSELLTNLYGQSHEEVKSSCRWIQLGSTLMFTENGWNDSNSTYDKGNSRALAEDELLRLLGGRASVLDLAGLYGGERQPRNWVTRVAKTKEEVKRKGAVHLVHGRDVGRAIIGAHCRFDQVGGKRWIVTDLHTYDWWDLIHAWGKHAREKATQSPAFQETKSVPIGLVAGNQAEDSMAGAKAREELQYERWVVELMNEEHVRALPRDTDRLGRVLDGRGFWEAIGQAPKEGRVS